MIEWFRNGGDLIIIFGLVFVGLVWANIELALARKKFRREKTEEKENNK